MSEKKRVLLVVSTLNTGGAQRAFANMSLGFPKDWECDFLLNDTDNITYPYRGTLIDLGMKPREDKTGLIYQLRVFLKRFSRLRRLKKSGRYAACISALTSANAVNVLTGSRRCRTIISIRIFMSRTIQGKQDYKSRLKAFTMRYLSNKADYVVAVSESMRRDMIQNFGVRAEKAVTIQNGYLPSEMQSLAREALLPVQQAWFRADCRTLITVGRLDRQKGQYHLIRAFRQIHESCPDTVLLILGAGELEEELRELIHGLGLEDCVILCGFVSNPYKILGKSDIFVLPSLFEGFPNTLAESLCLGIPAVSADCDSGAREILAPDTDIEKKVKTGFEKAEYGVLCPVCDGSLRAASEKLTEAEQALADAVLFLLQDEESYTHYKEQCLKRAEQLSIEQSVRKWIELIDE